jgi:four helix bundle protein
MEASVQNVDVYRLAHDLAVRIHGMTLALPAFERFEEGPQIRRSSKRVSASIVEGHTLRKHKAQYLSYLYRALASSDETKEHLQLLRKTGSLSDSGAFEFLSKSCEELSRKLFRFIQAIEKRYATPRYLENPPWKTLNPLRTTLTRRVGLRSTVNCERSTALNRVTLHSPRQPSTINRQRP